MATRKLVNPRLQYTQRVCWGHLMGHTGRNERCPCGSGKKFKRCHGSDQLMTELRARAAAGFRKVEAEQLQRSRQQGKGHPIVSTEVGDLRLVAVGGNFVTGRWKTFPDFLHDHIRITLGEAWGNTELAKHDEYRHPIIRWYQQLCYLQQQHSTGHGQVSSMPTFGVATAYLGLAYDLYLIDHNTASTPNAAARDRLFHRLRHPDQFVGARYELRVAAFFLRAGFTLEWTDETDDSHRHGEFVATYPPTGKSFWVECKIRQPHPKSDHGRNLGKFVSLVVDALKKPTDLDRLIFVDLNTPAKPKTQADEYDWRNLAINQLRKFEAGPGAKDLPPALVMVTNFPDHHHLDEIVPDSGGAIEGFKIDDFRMGKPLTLPDAIAQRERYLEVGVLMKSIGEHTSIPSTFDGTVPGLDDRPDRIRIGARYEVEPGVSGVLEDACVMEQDKQVAAAICLDDGTRGITFMPISDEELAAWRRYPETFFGEVRDHNPPSKSPLDLYDFFHKSLLKTPKENILAQLKNWPNLDQMAAMSQPDLAHAYAMRLAESATQSAGGFNPPAWMTRMRRPPSPVTEPAGAMAVDTPVARPAEARPAPSADRTLPRPAPARSAAPDSIPPAKGEGSPAQAAPVPTQLSEDDREQ